MKRIFIALPVDQALQETIFSWQQNLPDLPVRWLKGKNLHITLVPPWETDRVRETEVALQTLAKKFPSFNLNFEQVALGPDQFHPRLIWATGAAPKALLDLKQGIEEVTHFKPSRPFNLHLTLARFKEQERGLIPPGLFPHSVSWSCGVGSFVLMESNRFADGAEYEVLTEVTLNS